MRVSMLANNHLTLSKKLEKKIWANTKKHSKQSSSVEYNKE